MIGYTKEKSVRGFHFQGIGSIMYMCVEFLKRLVQFFSLKMFHSCG